MKNHHNAILMHTPIRYIHRSNFHDVGVIHGTFISATAQRKSLSTLFIGDPYYSVYLPDNSLDVVELEVKLLVTLGGSHWIPASVVCFVSAVSDKWVECLGEGAEPRCKSDSNS